MSKRYKNEGNNKYNQINDDFEDYGYNVKNIRRSHKKKVAKFKREDNYYEDS
tara:strand:- start:557 stop:712 length:156 start_codon:yes stop_codon:yes gene_type:complete